MRKDPYAVLGVGKKASQEEINKAFKSLAAKYHPDRNPDNPKEAEVKFKEVAAAYELVGDESKRRSYDFYSAGQFPSFTFRSRNNVDDVFDNLFSQFFGNGNPHPSAFKSRVKVTLAEAFSGCSRKVNAESHEPCSSCKGTGSSEWTKCSRCDGAGFLFSNEGPMRIQTSCSNCSGRGSVTQQSCKNCNGRGRIVNSSRELEVKIPAGVEDGTQIRVSSESGDMFVVVSVEKHPSIIRQQRNLLGFVELPYATLVLGGETKFDLFGTELLVKIPPRTKTGARMRIRGHGMPHLQNPDIKGDLFLEMGLKMPKEIGKEYEAALLALSKLESKN